MLAPVALVPLALAPISAGAASATTSARPAPATAKETAEAPLTRALAARLSHDVSQRVIVVLRDQATSQSQASDEHLETAAAAAERPLLDELHATGATDVHGLALVRDLIATVSPGEEARLRADPAVAEVVQDEPIRMAAPEPSTGADRAPRFTVPSGVCPAGKAVQLNPEAIELIHAAAQSGTGENAQALGYTGSGVKVGFIADAANPDDPDFIRADGQHVITAVQDFSNYGSGASVGGGEAFLDASSIAAQGREVYNLEDYATGLSESCRIRVLGVAPGASLVDLDTFGNSDSNFTSALLEAVDYGTLVDHVNVLNESFGDNPFPDVESLDLVEQADSAAVARGVTVTVSSGDAGPYDTIGSPASDPDVISAGASTSYRADLQTGIYGSVGGPVKVTSYLDDNISPFSSGGVTESGHTIDVVAPGDVNWALCSPTAQYFDCTNFANVPADLELSGGTSEAAPLTAGVAALVIQAFRQAHGGKTPSPAVVKQIITSTATDIDAPGDLEGAGLLDAYAAVEAAKSYGSAKGAVGHGVLTSAGQLDAAGPENTPEALRETLTNDGATAASVRLSTRTLTPWSSISKTSLSLKKASDGTYGAVVHFAVPSGEARLDTQIAYSSPTTLSTGPGAVVLTLYGPGGVFAAASDPQGTGNHGEAAIADPAPGEWTAFLAGYNAATAEFEARVANWAPLGTVSSASVHLAPGASTTVTVDATTPTSPGDEAGSLVLHNSAAGLPGFASTTTVPIILRAYVLTPAPTSTFTGTLTGGNGRSTDTGQSAYYQFSLPADEPAIRADISVPSAKDTFVAELVSPSGVAQSTASSSLVVETARGLQFEPEQGTQLHVPSPVAGVWTLAINFYNQVSGSTLFPSYAVSLSTAATDVTAPSLPDAAADDLEVGTPTTVDVTVTNTGDVPEAYFLDARTSTTTSMKLVPLTTASAQMPQAGETTPTYLVPSGAKSVTASAIASKPALFDFAYLFGDPDIIAGATGSTKRPKATYSPGASGVPAGVWAIVPYLDGPDGTATEKATVSTAMTVVAPGFDSSVTSPTGDLWESAVNASAGVTPYVAEPGQTVTIPMTITPTATAGTTVSGTLYIDTDSPVNEEAANTLFNPGLIVPSASEVAALPYEYTVTPR